ncbi:MAG: hypothetical protein JXX29_19835 [Deltaproteobacteria bacterium]|nr:hypothetical protein [Deltaproteobacteria bacterium]MBN2673942.1 hypothetical protein [Deltaproteobacteria bacterium]
MTEKNIGKDVDAKRGWYEKHAPLIYGIAVFTALVVFSLLHGLAIH